MQSINSPPCSSGPMNSSKVQPVDSEIDRRELIDDTIDLSSPPKSTTKTPQSEAFCISQANPWSANLLFAAITVCLSSFIFGYNIVTLEIERIFTTESLSTESGLYISPGQMNFVIGSFALGALIASLASGPLADKYGRKNIMLANAVIYLIGVFAFAFSGGFIQMLLGRSVIGIGAGIACVVAPMYLSEISYSTIRGVLGIFHQCSLVLGILTSQIVSYWFGNVHDWTIYFLGSGVAAFLMLIMLPFCPESPTFLIFCGNRNGSEKNLRFLRPSGWPVEQEVNEIHEAIAISRQNSSRISVSKLLSLSVARKSLLFGIMMHFTQQFSGIDLALLFPRNWFSTIRTIPIFVGCIFLVATLFAIWLVERAGRRRLTLASSLGCCIGLTFLMFFSHFKVHYSYSLFALFLFISSFSIGLGPITWIIINDIFPPNARASAMTLAVSVNWLSKFTVMLIYKPMFDRMKSFALLPFCFILFIFFCYAYSQMQETKGRPASYL